MRPRRPILPILPILAWFAAGPLSAEPLVEPAPGHPKTNQIEIAAPVPLLDASGNIAAAGWARRANMIYNREAVAPPLLGRVKEWEHYTIMSPGFTIGLTLAQLGSIAFGSFEVIEYPGGVKPGGFFLKMGAKEKAVFPPDPHGKPALESGGNAMTFEFSGGTRRLSFRFAATETAPAIEGEIELAEPAESIAIARPFADPGHFFYENKIFGMAAKGRARAGDKDYVLPEGESWAIFDWGRGIWPREVSWFWGQAAGKAGGRNVAFNLGHGYGDDSKGTCNAVLVDGKLHKLDSVILDYDKADRMKPWKIGSNDGRLTLEFRPIFHQHAQQAILVAKTELHKIHGRFTGTLALDDGSRIEVKDLLGFMEHAEHVW